MSYSILDIPALGSDGGPGGYSDKVNAILAAIGDPTPILYKTADGGISPDTDFGAAVDLAASERRPLWVVGKIRPVFDKVIPEAVPALILLGGMLAPDDSVGITAECPLIADRARQAFDLSAVGSAIVAAQVDAFYARQFGGRGSGTAGDEAYNDLAFAWMEATSIASNNANCNLGAGHFLHTYSLFSATGPNAGSALVGVDESTHQQGSADSTCVLDWVGDDADAYQIDAGGFVRIVGISLQNHGTARGAVKANAATGRGAERAHLTRVSTIVVGGANLWEDAPVYLQEFNYSELEHWECSQGPGLRLGPYGTSVDITGKSVLDPASAEVGTRSFIVVDDGFGGTVVNIAPGVTWNGRANCGTLWDNFTEDPDDDPTVTGPGNPGILNLYADDLTTNVQDASQPPIVKARKMVVSLGKSKIHQFNQLADNLFLLRDSRMFVAPDISGESISLPLVRGADEAGEQSYVYAGPCPDLNPANTKGIHDGGNSSAMDGSFISITPSAGVARIPLHLLNDGGVAKVTATGAVQIVFSMPGDGVPGLPRYGQFVVVELVNASGGALTPTYSPFVSHRGAAPAAIPNGQSIEVTYQFRGTIAVPAMTERFRSAVG